MFTSLDKKALIKSDNKDRETVNDEEGKNDSKPREAPEKEVPLNSKSSPDISSILNDIVTKALTLGASDIHIEPGEKQVDIRARIDGILNELMTLEKSVEPLLLFKVKISAKLPTDEHFMPLDGRITFVIDDKKLDTRISILPTTKGEKIVIRLLSSEGKSFDLEDLGIVGNDLEVVKRSYSKPYGMILAVGPTGSGKTTTLYSILKNLNSRGINITTIEDPVEYDISGVNHVQINTKVGLTFANGLRSILRQDPNVIMIGEIRDLETAKIAINAALTGHIVLSTLHTNDAITTIPRLIDMGIENFLVANTVNLIVAQRLARRLCENCKEEHVLSPKEHDELSIMRPDLAALIKKGNKFYKEKGCEKCHNTGFKGRIGLYEILEIRENLRRVISLGANNDDVYKMARENGLVLIVEDGVKKLFAGITSLSELFRVTAIKE